MPSVAHMLDVIDHGGMILSTPHPLIVDGRSVACVGDPVWCEQHGLQTIVTGSGVLMIRGQAVAVDGSQCSCGAVVSSASLLQVL